MKKYDYADDVIVCRCEEVTVKDIRDAIKAGAHSVNSIKRRTRACMGSCQSRSCYLHIARILSDELGISISEIEGITSRPPIQPIPIRLMRTIK